MKLAMPVSLMELLAIPLGCPKAAAKWLVISPTLSNPLLNPPRPLLNPPPEGEEAIALSPSGGKLERGFGEEAIVPSPSGGRLG